MVSARRTKVVCTIGPATRAPDALRGLLRAGMDVARFNLSHGTLDEHAEAVGLVRRLAREEGRPASLLLDLPGPKYRTGPLAAGAVTLAPGAPFILTTRPVAGDAREVAVNLPTFSRDVRVGDTVLVDDGALQLRVEAVRDGAVATRVLVGGRLTPGRGIAVPGRASSSPYLTPEFLARADFAVQQAPDFLALSLVSRPEDILQARAHLQRKGCPAALVAKIERRAAVDNFAAILAQADAVMVARGDLGVDMPLPDIPLVQKDIIRRANHAGKPVITATQMLESMISSPRPTRAEVTDVANAIFDGADALMLSGETAMGQYPVAAVEMMADIAVQTEGALPYRKLLLDGNWAAPETDELIAYSACYTAEMLGARAIVAFTTSGSTARRVARYRPRMPVLALTPDACVSAQLALSWGTTAFIVPPPESIEALFARAVEVARREGLAAKGDLLVITGGMPAGVAGSTNLLKVERVG